MMLPSLSLGRPGLDAKLATLAGDDDAVVGILHRGSPGLGIDIGAADIACDVEIGGLKAPERSGITYCDLYGIDEHPGVPHGCEEIHLLYLCLRSATSESRQYDGSEKNEPFHIG